MLNAGGVDGLFAKSMNDDHRNESSTTVGAADVNMIRRNIILLGAYGLSVSQVLIPSSSRHHAVGFSLPVKLGTVPFLREEVYRT